MSTASRHRYKEWETEQLKQVKYYTCVIPLGFPHGIDKRHAADLDEARELRRKMLAEYDGQLYGRGAMIYAVCREDNITIFVE